MYDNDTIDADDVISLMFDDAGMSTLWQRIMPQLCSLFALEALLSLALTRLNASLVDLPRIQSPYRNPGK